MKAKCQKIMYRPVLAEKTLILGENILSKMSLRAKLSKLSMKIIIHYVINNLHLELQVAGFKLYEIHDLLDEHKQKCAIRKYFSSYLCPMLMCQSFLCSRTWYSFEQLEFGKWKFSMPKINSSLPVVVLTLHIPFYLFINRTCSLCGWVERQCLCQHGFEFCKLMRLSAATRPFCVVLSPLHSLKFIFLHNFNVATSRCKSFKSWPPNFHCFGVLGRLQAFDCQRCTVQNAPKTWASLETFAMLVPRSDLADCERDEHGLLLKILFSNLPVENHHQPDSDIEN